LDTIVEKSQIYLFILTFNLRKVDSILSNWLIKALIFLLTLC